MNRPGSITLHPKHGVNPHLTFCPRCNGDGPAIVLLGANDDKFTCSKCDVVSYGSRHCLSVVDGRACNSYDGKREKIGERERLPSDVLCAACVAEVAEHKAEVARGGVYFKCTDCGCAGVIKAGTSFALAVREAHDLAVPASGDAAPCGVEFTKADCPKCGPDASTEVAT